MVKNHGLADDAIVSGWTVLLQGNTDMGFPGITNQCNRLAESPTRSISLVVRLSARGFASLFALERSVLTKTLRLHSLILTIPDGISNVDGFTSEPARIRFLLLTVR
jgi:hypothetical protein